MSTAKSIKSSKLSKLTPKWSKAKSRAGQLAPETKSSGLGPAGAAFVGAVAAVAAAVGTSGFFQLASVSGVQLKVKTESKTEEGPGREQRGKGRGLSCGTVPSASTRIERRHLSQRSTGTVNTDTAANNATKTGPNPDIDHSSADDCSEAGDLLPEQLLLTEPGEAAAEDQAGESIPAFFERLAAAASELKRDEAAAASEPQAEAETQTEPVKFRVAIHGLSCWGKSWGGKILAASAESLVGKVFQVRRHALRKPGLRLGNPMEMSGCAPGLQERLPSASTVGACHSLHPVNIRREMSQFKVEAREQCRAYRAYQEHCRAKKAKEEFRWPEREAYSPTWNPRSGPSGTLLTVRTATPMKKGATPDEVSELWMADSVRLTFEETEEFLDLRIRGASRSKVHDCRDGYVRTEETLAILDDRVIAPAPGLAVAKMGMGKNGVPIGESVVQVDDESWNWRLAEASSSGSRSCAQPLTVQTVRRVLEETLRQKIPGLSDAAMRDRGLAPFKLSEDEDSKAVETLSSIQEPMWNREDEELGAPVRFVDLAWTPAVF